jgi:hypothetical protein
VIHLRLRGLLHAGLLLLAGLLISAGLLALLSHLIPETWLGELLTWVFGGVIFGLVVLSGWRLDKRRAQENSMGHTKASRDDLSG